MFTIMHQRTDGREAFYPATHVDYVPDWKGDSEAGISNCVQISTYTPAGEPDGTIKLESGRVFVMNDSGATVGSYILSNRSSV